MNEITIKTKLDLKTILETLNISITELLIALSNVRSKRHNLEYLKIQSTQLSNLSVLASDFETLIFEQKNTKNEL